MPNQPFPNIRTARLTLREIHPADAQALLTIYADTPAMRWYGLEPIVEREEVEKLIANYAEWRLHAIGIRWGIELDGELIGTAGFFRWNKSWHNCMVGYELAKEHRAKGYMRETLRAIVGYGFSHMALHRIHAEIHPSNAPSIALIERLGFRFEGVHREMGFWNGRWHDLHFYSMLEQEWVHG